MYSSLFSSFTTCIIGLCLQFRVLQCATARKLEFLSTHSEPDCRVGGKNGNLHGVTYMWVLFQILASHQSTSECTLKLQLQVQWTTSSRRVAKGVFWVFKHPHGPSAKTKQKTAENNSVLENLHWEIRLDSIYWERFAFSLHQYYNFSKLLPYSQVQSGRKQRTIWSLEAYELHPLPKGKLSLNLHFLVNVIIPLHCIIWHLAASKFHVVPKGEVRNPLRLDPSSMSLSSITPPWTNPGYAPDFKQGEVIHFSRLTRVQSASLTIA